MTQTILIILGIAIVVILLSRRTREKVLRPAQDKIVGICAAAIGLDAKKRENKEKILVLLREPFDSTQGKREFSNSDIREALGVSATSVVRYMDELEKEGKAEQIGAVGHTVKYRLR